MVHILILRTPPPPPDFASPPRVFVLIHKMDLVSEENRETVFMNRKQVISDISGGVDLTFFMTSIWDETLYKVSEADKFGFCLFLWAFFLPDVWRVPLT